MNVECERVSRRLVPVLKRGLLIILCSLWLCPLPASAGTRRPNVVILVSDDMGYADVGFQGCKDIPTPHIDSIANDGVRFTSGYVSGPYCSPTRAGLLTGRYQTRFGHEFNPVGNVGLPVTETTVAERFRRAGYATGLVGKWHLGAQDVMRPQKRGFQEFFGFLGGSHPYLPGGKGALHRGAKVVPEREYLTDALGREATDFIARHKTEPFLLYLAFNAPHMPMEADDARLKKFAAIKDPLRRTYAAMMSAMDDAIGRVLGRLRADGLDTDTLVFFFSDNGGCVEKTWPGTTLNGASNAPLRGTKRQTLEGGVRVPFAFRWTGHVPAGLTYARPVIQLDVVPTALAAAGIPYDRLDGVDLLPFLSGASKAEPHEALYWRFGDDWAVRKGDWKLVKYYLPPELAKNEAWPKLYHLAEDVGEADDLAAKHPDKVRELTADWKKWNQGNVPPLWTAESKMR